MFEQLVVTNLGQTLLANALAGDMIQFTKIKLGNKTAPAPADIKSLTDLVSTKQVLNVARSSILNGSQVNVGANLMGVDVTSAFNWTEVGIFAKNLTSGGAEILFSYQYATTPVPIPQGGTVAEMLIDFVISVGDSENVEIEIDKSLIFLTQEDLDNGLIPVNSAIGLLQSGKEDKLNAASSSPTEKFYRGDKTWQTLNKAAVGLGNVANNATATKTEAENGSASDKFMTPQRTKEAVEKYSVISDGNVIIKIGNTQPTPIAGKTIIFINTSS